LKTPKEKILSSKNGFVSFWKMTRTIFKTKDFLKILQNKFQTFLLIFQNLKINKIKIGSFIFSK